MYERFLWLIYCGIALLLFRSLEKFLERTHLIKTPIEHRTPTGYFAAEINKEIFNRASRDLSGSHKHLESWTTEANNSYIYSIGFSKKPGQAGIINIIYPYSGPPGKWNFQIIQEISFSPDWPKGESFEEYLSKNPEYVIPDIFKKDAKKWTIIEGKEWFLFLSQEKNKSMKEKIKKIEKIIKNCGQEVKLDKFFILNQWLRNHRKWILVIIGIILVFIIISSHLSSNHTSYKNNITQEDIALSVVNIFCSSKDGKILSGGSGTMFAEDGGVLTNYHVVAKTDICLVIIPNATSGAPNEMYLAKPLIVPKISEQYDIAFLKITGAYVDKNGISYGIYPNKFKIFKIFDNSEYCIGYTPKLGESIKVYGYPVTSGGYNLTITDGIVSSFADNGLILTSAKIDSGNSGGLAINKDGCFVGIPSAVQTGKYQNLGVLIPATVILDFLNQVYSRYYPR